MVSIVGPFFSRATNANSSHYKRKTRSVAADKAGYDTLAEQISLFQLKSLDWAGILFNCLVHIIYGVHKSVYKVQLVNELTSGMINFALSFRPGGSLASLRRALLQSLMNVIEIVQTLYCSLQAVQYKEWIFTLFYGDGLEVQELKIVLVKCFPDD